MHILAITPTYNEKDNIEALAHAVTHQGYDLLVVDDNSPDGTAALVSHLAATNDRIKLMHRTHTRGFGSAYVDGFTYALSHNYDKIIMMDADLSHDPAELAALTGSSSGLTIGSRYVASGSIAGWPWYRYLLSKCANAYAALVLDCGIADLTSGYNCFTRDALEQLDFRTLCGEGYSFLIELKYRAFQKQVSITEVPILFHDRTNGRSKMSKKIIWEAFWLVPKLRLALNN